MQWFRFYSEALDDPKVQRLPGHLFKAWVNLLCLANEQDKRGTLPDAPDIAFRLRVPDADATTTIAALVKAGLLESNGAGQLRIHAWDKRQFASDTSTDRVRKFREKQRETANETERNKRETFQKRSRNAIDTDTDTEADQIQKQKQRQSGERATRATPAPDVFPITASMRSWAAEHAPEVDLDRETERFLDRNRANGTTYRDWIAAWRNWMTSPYAKAPARPTSRAPDLHVVNGVALSPRMARNVRIAQETEL